MGKFHTNLGQEDPNKNIDYDYGVVSVKFEM